MRKRNNKKTKCWSIFLVKSSLQSFDVLAVPLQFVGKMLWPSKSQFSQPTYNWLLVFQSVNEINKRAGKFEMVKKRENEFRTVKNTSNGMDTYGWTRETNNTTCSAASNKKNYVPHMKCKWNELTRLDQLRRGVVLLFIIFNFIFFSGSSRCTYKSHIFQHSERTVWLETEYEAGNVVKDCKTIKEHRENEREFAFYDLDSSAVVRCSHETSSRCAPESFCCFWFIDSRYSIHPGAQQCQFKSFIAFSCESCWC